MPVYTFFRLCIICLSISASLQGSGTSSVWEVTKGENKLYLAGSCHVLRADDFPLPKQFDAAYAQSDWVVFETDVSKMKDPVFAMQLMQMSRYEAGKSLKTELSPETYKDLEAASAQVGLPLSIIESFKPGMALTMVTMQALLKKGVSQEGVDFVFHSKAIEDGKTIRSLETADFQAGLIANLGLDQPDMFVCYSLSELDELETQFSILISAWKSGDDEKLSRLFVDDLKQHPEIYNTFLRDRNDAWLPQIEEYLETPVTEMVVVGVAHLVGSDGLIALLRAGGYTVQQLP